MKRVGPAALVIAGWFILAFIVIHPLANASVVDGWLYAHTARHLVKTGTFQFGGFSQAMPVAQALYGAAWTLIFGGSPRSLDLSVALLGAVGGLLMFLLAHECGADDGSAMLSALILICNPCYLFLSFSFMTEGPFVASLTAAYLAFARSARGRETLWLWIFALLTLISFMVRPFALIAIAGAAIALIIYDARPMSLERADVVRRLKRLAPLAAAFVLCALGWIWLMWLHPRPWDLTRQENHFKYLARVPLLFYLRNGILNPLLYLGIVLSPLALLQLFNRRFSRVIAIAVGIFAATVVLARFNPGPPATPDLGCFGGWDNVLVLRGLPARFAWHGDLRWAFAALGSFGAAGLIIAAPDVIRRLDRGAAAVMVALAIYWAALLPLWFFDDRYFLVMVPAGCLFAALSPMPRPRRVAGPAALAMTAVLGVVSLGGLFAYQRGLAAVAHQRDLLLKSGVPRSQIDAGYSLNGQDLYRWPPGWMDTKKEELGIPLITSSAMEPYTIAAAPIPGTTIIRTFTWPGPFFSGTRTLYVLRRNEAKTTAGARTP